MISIESAASGSIQSAPRQSWREVWLKAITQPSVATYEDIVARPDVTPSRAYTWVFLSSLIGSALAALRVVLFGGVPGIGETQGIGGTTSVELSAVTLICIVPIGALFAVLSLIIIAGISNAIARALGGSGRYAEVSYAFAAYLAPIGLLSSGLGMVPILSCLAIPIGVYGLALNVLAIKSVHHISWGKALLSSVVIIAGILVFLAVTVIVILALLGPAIGDIFSNIIREIVTPAP